MTKKELVSLLVDETIRYVPFDIRKYIFKKAYKFYSRKTKTQLLDIYNYGLVGKYD